MHACCVGSSFHPSKTSQLGDPVFRIFRISSPIVTIFQRHVTDKGCKHGLWAAAAGHCCSVQHLPLAVRCCGTAVRPQPLLLQHYGSDLPAAVAGIGLLSRMLVVQLVNASAALRASIATAVSSGP